MGMGMEGVDNARIRWHMDQAAYSWLDTCQHRRLPGWIDGVYALMFKCFYFSSFEQGGE